MVNVALCLCGEVWCLHGEGVGRSGAYMVNVALCGEMWCLHGEGGSVWAGLVLTW